MLGYCESVIIVKIIKSTLHWAFSLFATVSSALQIVLLFNFFETSVSLDSTAKNHVVWNG